MLIRKTHLYWHCYSGLSSYKVQIHRENIRWWESNTIILFTCRYNFEWQMAESLHVLTQRLRWSTSSETAVPQSSPTCLPPRPSMSRLLLVWTSSLSLAETRICRYIRQSINQYVENQSINSVLQLYLHISINNSIAAKSGSFSGLWVHFGSFWSLYYNIVL